MKKLSLGAVKTLANVINRCGIGETEYLNLGV